jgi:chaperonin GroEL
MVTDTDKMEAKIEKPYILVTENKLLSIKDLVPLIEELVAK